jgi:hypothetical protein
VVQPQRLIFVDECGTHTLSAPIYGYAPRGKRLHPKVPRGRGKNTTLLSSMSTQGMGPSLTVEEAITARAFETYVQKVVAPNPKEGQIVVMNELGAHRPKRIRKLIEQQGCELLYLPAYCPEPKSYNDSALLFMPSTTNYSKPLASGVPISTLHQESPRLPREDTASHPRTLR